MQKTKVKSRFNMKHNIEFVLRDKDGAIKPQFQPNKLSKLLGGLGEYLPKIFLGKWQDKLVVSNLVVDAGKAGVASRINGAGSEALFDYIAIGEGTTAANAADTTVETEITTGGGSRAQGTASRVTTDVTNDTAQLVLTFSFTASFAVTESGVLNAGAAGTLLARQVFSAINVANGDSLQVTWKFDVD